MVNLQHKKLPARGQDLALRVALSLLAAGLWATQTATALTVTAVTSGNGHPAHKVQWTDSAGQPRSAILVDQTTSGPGYLYSLTYQYNGSPRVCTGSANTYYPGDGFVENHNTQGSDNNSLDDSTPGTTTIVLQGTSHAIIEYSMPTYQILGITVPTTICWVFADGRSHPIFAISQDARATSGNLGADTRSPYGSIYFDGTADGASDIGGASYGDTLKFVTLAMGPENVTGLSGWSDKLTNTIPYAMEWIDPAEVDAEMGHVATLPITIQDQGADRNANSTLDPRNTQAPSGPMIPYGASDTGPDAWAFQLLDYILHPDYVGDTQEAGASVQASYSKLAWGGNFGRVGGSNNGNNTLDGTKYSAHYDCGANILTGTRLDGMLCAYSVFVVLGSHNGSYTNGSVGQEVIQMQNVTHATIAAATGTVATTGPAGVGSAASKTITYSPGGYNPTYAAWELSASTNAINATLTPATNAPLDHPVFIVDQYTSSQLPGNLAVGTGWTNAGVDYFVSVDTNAQRLWITVNRAVSNAMNLVVNGPGGGGGGVSAPVISSFPATAQLGSAIIITGTNFTGATNVAFNGVESSFTVNSSTKITATVPALATTGPITVITPGGTAHSVANFTIQAASTNLLIYVDSLLNGFQDYSWATVNFSNTLPVYAGSDSISVSNTQYSALWPYHAPFNTAPYASLSFWINGGASGAPGLQVMGVTNNYETAIYNLPTLAANSWVHFNLPLSALGVANITNCDGFWFYANSPGTNTFYVDSIQLNTATAPTLTAVPPKPGSGSFVLQLAGFSGQTYWIETSTNLLTWTHLSTNTLTSASLNITNVITGHANQQYWRAQAP